MSAPTHDLLCIGNAIVDVLASVDPAVIADLGATPGSMTLIDAATAQAIENQIAVERVAGGGSGANTAVVAARMGAKVSYLGKVAEDQAGTHFAQDIRDQGLTFPSQPLAASEDIPTARCIVLVTPDGQRTMFTYLGAARNLHRQTCMKTRLRMLPSPTWKAICTTSRTRRLLSSMPLRWRERLVVRLH